MDGFGHRMAARDFASKQSRQRILCLARYKRYKLHKVTSATKQT